MALSRGYRSVWRTCSGLVARYPLWYGSAREHGSDSGQLIPRTSLSRPPWPDPVPVCPEEERRRHAEVVSIVQQRVQRQDFGRLFAVVHFASRQWKVTDEDLILIENHFDAECGDRIRMEKVLLVGAQDFTLVGRPLLGKDLVRVEATVIEKTESWPKILMRFRKRKRYKHQKTIIQPQTVLRINTIQLYPGLC
ncbi:large ribosomal subunit protein bL21m [Austrofundulus limnaeus]|uniref:Large ribosomal subunit protein bL21m n=1 Tax=Austrofundulus limnaeus TaxID=52670 RepID=A0A2I4CK75_AUSLI|nr:PREDICTED: 39S ribosomal protein L21, mitochondrial [Austrofundulus limnaeus]